MTDEQIERALDAYKQSLADGATYNYTNISSNIIEHNKVLSALDNEQNSKIQQFYEQKKDYKEFVTSWVHKVKTPIYVSRLLIENNSNTSNKETFKSIEEGFVLVNVK